MGHRGHVFDGRDLQANGLQGPDSGLPTGARSTDFDFHFLHAMRHGLSGGVLGHLLGREEELSYEDMAKAPKPLKDAIGRENWVILSNYRKIEQLWPQHRLDT